MKTKHTQGKWRVENDFNISMTEKNGMIYGFLQTKSFRNVKDVNKWDEEKAKANAKLIAAAPELLEFAIEMVKRYPNSPWITEQGNKAIKKATK